MSSSKSKDIPPSSFLIPLSTALLYVGNMWYAVIKKSLASSTPLMQKELGITATDIGEFSASFSLCYGLFKLVGGLLSDIYPVCTLYSGCLLLGGMMNICIPMLYINKDKYTYTNNAHINSFRSMFSLIPMLKVCWSVNGVVQGAGGPALSKITIDFFPAQHRSRAWSALLTASNLGYLLAPYMLMYPLYTIGWQGPFLFAGVVGVLISILMLVCPITNTNIASNTQEDGTGSQDSQVDSVTQIPSYTHTPPSHTPSPTPILSHTPTHTHTTTPVSVYVLVLQTVYAIMLVVAQGAVYFVVKSLSDWTVHYLMFGPSGMSYASAILVGFWCEVGAITGQSLSGLVGGMHILLINILFALISLLGCVWAMMYAYIIHETSTHTHHSSYILSTCDVLLSICIYIPPSVVYAIRASTRECMVYVWCMLLFIVGFGINGPKSLLQLKATEQCICAYNSIYSYFASHTPSPSPSPSHTHTQTPSDTPTHTHKHKQTCKQTSITGTLSGVVGLCAQVGASCSGIHMSSYIHIHYEYIWPVCIVLCISVVGMLCVCVWVEKIIEGREKKKAE